MTTETTSKKRPDLIAYFVPERENARWTEIGAAWANRDGEGYSLRLDLVPTGPGGIVLRKRKEAEAGGEEGGA